MIRFGMIDVFDGNLETILGFTNEIGSQIQKSNHLVTGFGFRETGRDGPRSRAAEDNGSGIEMIGPLQGLFEETS